MTEYGYDLYPRDDPRDGTRLVRYTYEDLIAAEYQDVIGVGAGQATIWVDHAGAEHIDKRGEQYIRVVRLGGVEAVVGGIWTSKLPFETAVASERRHLTISGPAQMAYLARARMAPHTYIHDVFTGQDPFDGMWRLSAQSTVYANGSYLGAMLWRVLYEAQHFRNTATYTHRHADGLTYTDSHADDRLVSRIPDLVLGFDQFEDSNGTAWTMTAGEFGAQVGENVLGVVQRIMQSGLFLWMDPDSFTLYAYEGRPATKLGRSTDRAGVAWGAGVVRFQSPTDGTTATGNILSDATRVVNAYLPQGPIWVGGNDIYHKETGAADALYEGFVHSTAEDDAALATIGAAQSTAREEAADVGQLRVVLGDDPTNGAYLPGEHYRVDELARINTGAGEFDYDEANYPVGAWRVSLPKDAAEWEAHVDLGASYEEARSREFAIAPGAGHTHPPNPQLCEPRLFSPATLVSATLGTPDAALTVGSLTDGALIIAVHRVLGAWGPPTVTWTVGASVETATLIDDTSFLALYVLHNPQVGSGTVAASGHLVGVWVVENAATPAITSWQFSANVTDFETSSAVTTAAGGELVLDAFSVWDPDFIDDGVPDAATPGGGQTQDWSHNSQLAGLGYTDSLFGGSHGDASPTWAWDGPHPWRAFVAIVNGSDNLNLIGTSTRGKRCDDTEHYHTTADPTVNDDTTRGFRNGTMWINESTGAMFLLLDNAEGAADWLAVGGAGADLSGINFLVGTASGDLSAEIVVGTTPGGELGGTWAAPTVDVTHSGSAHHTESHQARHANGGADEVAVEGLPTAETDTALVLHPDGAGGIEWGTDEGGGGAGMAGELVTDTIIGDGVEDTFALSDTPTGSWALVSTNGADLLPSEYAIVAGDIIFDVAPVNLAEVLVTFIVGGFTAPATDPGDIADPTLATAEDVALKLNALMAELRTAGIIV